jgi:hypothetical protein
MGLDFFIFLFFLPDVGGKPGSIHVPKSRRGKKTLIYFILNLLFPDVLLKFLTTRKISITKILKKEIKE